LRRVLTAFRHRYPGALWRMFCDKEVPTRPPREPRPPHRWAIVCRRPALCRSATRLRG
jgi:hypothetical protein